MKIYAPPESPSNKIVAALQQYAEELEALKLSLESTMMLFGFIRNQKQKELKEFAEANGSDIREEGDSIRFNIPAHKITDYQRIEAQLRSLQSSQKLMPRNLLVALVCTYDAFMGKLIRFVLEVQPSILDASERQLSFSELQAFDSISSAREHIIEKEIETVLRKSHIEHFKWLEAKLGTSFNNGLQSWPAFVELTERRNLFVHADGVVSSQYLRVCKDHKCKVPEDTIVGTRLGAPKSYFLNSYHCLYEIGIKLAHVIWRRLLKTELEAIDDNLCEVTYSLIEKQDYPVAIRVLEFFTQKQMDHYEDSSKRVMIINLAQAYKWNGDQNKCIALLRAHDWSSSQDKFNIGVSTLKEEWDEVYGLMRSLRHDPKFNKKAYKDWPLFKQLRKEEKFPAIYEECYGEPFASQEEIVPSEQKEDNSEQADAANPHPFGTSVTPPADPAPQAGGAPEASGDS